MKPFFIRTPSGDLIAFHHIVSLEVEQLGELDQLRHEVQATTVTGDRHTLETYRGPQSRDQADHLIAELMRQGEVHTFHPRVQDDPTARR